MQSNAELIETLRKLADQHGFSLVSQRSLQRGMFYTTAEVAELLKVDSDTVRRWIHDGRLKASNVARGRGARKRFRISQQSLEDFAAGCETKGRATKQGSCRRPLSATRYF